MVMMSACGSQKRVVVAKKKEIPSWYQTPPTSTQSTLYGVGVGKDKTEAISDALTQMISTLSVEVSSTYSSKTVARDGSVESFDGTYTKEMQSVVKPIRISNYKVLEAKNLGYKNYAVLVSSNTNELYKSMLQEINQDFEIFFNKEKSIKKQNALQQLAFYKKSKLTFQLLPNKLLILKQLKSDFNPSPYLEAYNEIESKYEQLHSHISFKISANSNAINLKTPIAKALSAKEFKISSRNTQESFRIYISAQINKANSYGFTLARATINITTKDYKGSVIGSNRLDIVGQSSQSYAIAKENIALKLSMLIEKEGIEKVLGLSI